MKRMQFRYFFILSLIGHAGLVFVASKIKTEPTTAGNQVTEIEFIEPESKSPEITEPEPKQIVDQSDKAVNDQLDPEAKFLSKNNQTVKKQTVAQNRGDFVNSDGSGNTKGSGSTSTADEAKSAAFEKFKPQFNVQKMVEDRIAKDQNDEKVLEAQAMARFKEPSPQNSSQDRKPGTDGSQASQTLDYIKDIDPGLETLLSTKEFKYHSFYSRMRSKLNEHWTPIVRQRMENAYKKGRSIASEDDKITKLLVTLDKQGNLVKVQVISNSGISDVDEAAVDAFRSAAPFPNPPNGMVDGDGQIKIRWDFVIEA